MPITSLPQQETYKSPDIFKKTLDRARDVGRSLQQVRPQPTTSPATRFPQLAGAVRDTGVQPSATGSPLEMFKNLGPVTVPFQGSTRYEPGGQHLGTDIGIPSGTQIPSFTAGTVTDVRSGQGWTPKSPSFGNFITITTPTGEQVRYSHLHSDWVPMPVGTQVSRGTILGESGASGSTYSGSNPNAPGYHLDVRIKDLAGQYLSPSNYLAGLK